jgi:hypothetical protein
MEGVVPTPITPIRVFLASPGDVAGEREAVRQAASELNESLRKHGFEIEILGWEQRGPAAGRAQADIDKDVECCDVLLGILAERWGTRTGESSSGFAEEWELARDRYKRTGTPDLWVYFREPGSAEGGEADDPQRELVRAFCKEIEDQQIAFHKSFRTTEEFSGVIRGRLLKMVLERSNLTRAELGIALDWAAAYEEEPVFLLAQGPQRLALAEDLLGSDPQQAAALLSALGAELHDLGLPRSAGELQVRACRALLSAGASKDAVKLLRSMLAERVWWMRLTEIESLLHGLREELPPEVAGELTAWRACARAGEDPERVVAAISAVPQHAQGFPLDESTRAHWKALSWRCLLHLGRPREILDQDPGEPSEADSDVKLELVMVHADALRAADESERADAAWAKLRLVALGLQEKNPQQAVWIETRAALGHAVAERLGTAKGAFADAATRWSALAGGNEHAAMCFYSAGAAAHLQGDWHAAFSGLRELAGMQRSSAMTFARRAQDLEDQAARLRADGSHEQALVPLTLALWCHERAGLLAGILDVRSQLAQSHRAVGRYAEAAELYCRCMDRSGAETAAGEAGDPAAVAARLAGSWPTSTWMLEARCAALAQVGRAAPAEFADELIAIATGGLSSERRPFDNTPAAAASALASLAVAAQDPTVAATAAEKLRELMGVENYLFAKAGRHGLRLLADAGENSHVAPLIDAFIAAPQVGEPDEYWVAEHARESGRLDELRHSTLEGNRRALAALIRAGLIAHDAQLRELCRQITSGMLESDLGMTRDGQGIQGLLALGDTGAVAAASADQTLIADTAEKLLLYACESRWPTVNRVKALEGLWELRGSLDHAKWLDRLEPLAAPEHDLDDELRVGQLMWTQRGDLQAMALRLAAHLAEDNAAPTWLDRAAREAILDERTPLVQAAWYVAGIRAEWFDAASARHALRHPASEVRIAALRAWQQSAREPVPPAYLHRLTHDEDLGVRLALIAVLTVQADEPAAEILRSDLDAYVRRIALRELPPPTQSTTQRP